MIEDNKEGDRLLCWRFPVIKKRGYVLLMGFEDDKKARVCYFDGV